MRARSTLREIWMATWNEQQAERLKSWTMFFDRLSRRMSDDYWEHAAAFGRYVDDLARARSIATFEEARRSYRDRVLSLLEQSMQGYAQILERPVPERVDHGVAAPSAPVATPAEESDSMRAKAAADALLDVVRQRAAAEKSKVAAPTKRKRTTKPRKRKTSPDNDAPG